MSLITLSPAQALYNEQLAVALGLLTLVAGIGLFSSCRTCVSLLGRLGVKQPLEKPLFKRLYGFHPYFWWAFVMFLVLHVATAFFHTGFPIKGDPDAGIHWWILGLGFASTLTVPATFLSCRSVATAFEFLSQKNPLSWKFYRGIYRFHGYYWWLLGVLVISHFIVAGLHVNFWPTVPPA